MTLFEGEQNGRYETDHLHMVLNEHIDFTEEGLSDDRKYSIFVHEYVHYYQHFATLYGSQFCKMANLLFIETRAFLEGADKVVMPFGIWEHNEGISRYRNRVKAVCGSKSCSHIVGDVEIDRRAGFELIFRRLQKIDGDICPMYRVCKDGRFSEESNVDELCGKEQWKKDCECLMVCALKYYKLKDKEFVS